MALRAHWQRGAFTDRSEVLALDVALRYTMLNKNNATTYSKYHHPRF
jgi:hypothetical protein